MMDLVQLQEDVTALLRSSYDLAFVNVVQYRKLRLESEGAMEAVWQTPRNSRSGAGIIVEMPTATVQSPNVTGPAFDLILPVVCVEEPNLNFAPTTGTHLSAEEIAQWVFDLLHLQSIAGIGTLQARRIAEAPEYQNLIAYRAEMVIINPRSQTARCAAPQISVAAGEATLTTTTSDAEIRYTLDESFPAREGNPASQLYAGPFAVESGQVVRFTVYKSGFNPSEVRQSTIP